MGEVQICPLCKNTLNMSFRVIANGSYMQVQNTCGVCGWSIIGRATRLNHPIIDKPDKKRKLKDVRERYLKKTRKALDKLNSQTQSKSRPMSRYGPIVEKDNSITDYKIIRNIYAIVTGRLPSGRKIWTEYDYENDELINPKQHYLLTTGHTYPSNNMFFKYNNKKEI